MNALHSSAQRLANSLQGDILKLETEDSSAGMQGQIAASLSSLSRTIDDYSKMSERELILAKREKANSRTAKLRDDEKSLREAFERAKRIAASNRENRAREDLMGGNAASTSRQRLTGHGPSNSISSFQPNRVTSGYGSDAPPYGNMSQSDYQAVREDDFIRRTDSQLDQYLQQGQEVLNGLLDQKTILKGTQKRLLDAANGLNMGRDVINFIERRRPVLSKAVR